MNWHYLGDAFMRRRAISLLLLCLAACTAGCGDETLGPDAARYGLAALIEARWLELELQRRGIDHRPPNTPAAGRAERLRAEIRLRRRILMTRLKVTEDDVVSYYHAHRSEYPPPRE